MFFGRWNPYTHHFRSVFFLYSFSFLVVVARGLEYGYHGLLLVKSVVSIRWLHGLPSTERRRVETDGECLGWSISHGNRAECLFDMEGRARENLMVGLRLLGS